MLVLFQREHSCLPSVCERGPTTTTTTTTTANLVTTWLRAASHLRRCGCYCCIAPRSFRNARAHANARTHTRTRTCTQRYYVELKHALCIDPHMLVTRNAKALLHDAQKIWATHCPTGRLVSLEAMRGIVTSMELHLHFPVGTDLDCFTAMVREHGCACGVGFGSFSTVDWL